MDDLWDFGTVRHVSRQATIGRKDANSYVQNGPPSPTRARPNAHVNVNNNTSSPRRTGSEISLQSSITAKGERLPPIPTPGPHPPSSPTKSTRSFDTQATIRHAEPPAPPAAGHSNSNSISVRDYVEEDEEEDYGELLEQEPYPPMAPQHDNNRHLQDLPDTAMLDSVVLPAIASVGYSFPLHIPQQKTNSSLQLFPRVTTQEARIALSALQRAFTDAERIIPGVTNELVNEIVDSVEHVEEVV